MNNKGSSHTWSSPLRLCCCPAWCESSRCPSLRRWTAGRSCPARHHSPEEVPPCRTPRPGWSLHQTRLEREREEYLANFHQKYNFSLTFERALKLLAGGECLAGGWRNQLDSYVAEDLQAGLLLIAGSEAAVDLHGVLLCVLLADLPPRLERSAGGPQRDRSPHGSQRGPGSGQSRRRFSSTWLHFSCLKLTSDEYWFWS